MNIEAKPKTLVAVSVAILIVVGGYFYWSKTAEVRRYKAETKQLWLISEHQEIEIKVIEQKATLDAFKRETNRNTPIINLVPRDPNQ